MAVGFLASKAAEAFAGWLDRRGRIKEAQTQAQIVRAEKAANAEVDLSLELVRNSFKDELILIWFLGLATLCFIPSLAPFVALGMQNLAAMPLWFQSLFSASVLTSLGLRVRDALRFRPIGGSPK